MSKQLLIISYSNIRRDIRIQKHEHFFRKMGYEVDFLWRSLDEIHRFPFIKKCLYLFSFFFMPEKAVEILYGKLKYEGSDEFKFDVVLANDWNTLPIACRISGLNRSKLIYDTHELATREFEDSLKWKLMLLPLIKTIERKYIKKADLVSSVTPMITNEIKEKYNLKNVISVKNIPRLRKLDNLIQVEAKYPLRIYHHGVYIKSRDIESFIEAVIYFKDKYELYVRLVGDTTELRKKYSNSENVFFLEPVSSNEVLRSCTSYHIGMPSVYPANKNYEYCLPNKFYEYVLAGLPVIISAENIVMKEYVTKHKLGFIAEKHTKNEFIKVLDVIFLKDIIDSRKEVKKYKLKLSAIKEWNQYFIYLNHSNKPFSK